MGIPDKTKYFALLLLMLALAVTLTGCTTPVGLATKYVDKVCQLPPLERELLRQNADSATFPHKIRVECN